MEISIENLIFGLIIGAFIGRIIYNIYFNPPVGDYSWDIETPILIMIAIAFILIWGGIFWW